MTQHINIIYSFTNIVSTIYRIVFLLEMAGDYYPSREAMTAEGTAPPGPCWI